MKKIENRYWCLIKKLDCIKILTKAGFNKVLGVFGDDTYGDNTYALIGLEKELI